MQIKASRGPMLPTTREHDSPRSPTIKDSTGQRCPVEGRSALTDPAPGSPRMWRGAAVFGRLRLLADAGSVGAASVSGKPVGGQADRGWLPARPGRAGPGGRVDGGDAPGGRGG